MIPDELVGLVEPASWVPVRQPHQRKARGPDAISLVRAGDAWDAIVVPDIGLQVADGLAFLGDYSSAILADPVAAKTYFFAATGTAERWRVPGTRAVGRGGWVALTFFDVTSSDARPHWVPPIGR